MKNKKSKIYYMEYWRNDGGWHDFSYDRSPGVVFSARDDEEAKELAKAYISEHTRSNEDVNLMKFFEIEFNIEKRKIDFEAFGRSTISPKFEKPSKGLVHKIDSMGFTGIKEFLEGKLNE